MNFKKTKLYLLLSIFLLIFVYNYVLPYILFANTGNTRMGMHMGQNSVSYIGYYFGDFISIIFVVILVAAGLVILRNMLFSSNKNRCRKCGQTIESDSWKICPNCGNTIPHKGDDKQ